MSDVQDPTIARRRLRTGLRAARDEAGQTQEQAAERLEWSLSKLIRIEAGTVGVSSTDVRAMLQTYGVGDQARVQEMLMFARAARQKSWWAPYKEFLPPGFAAFIGLEGEVGALYIFQPMVVPGIMQTPDYAAHVMSNQAPGVLTDAEQAARIAVRLGRQERLLRGPRPPKIHTVLDEAVLHRIAGSAEVMRTQLLHLVTLGNLANITIRILPFVAGVNTVHSPFVLMEFPDGADGDVVYYESEVSSSQVMERIEGIAPYRHAFERLSDACLPPAESLAYIAKIAGELK